MPKITRALKLEVVFPGLREADRSARYKELWRMQDDLTRASNRLVSALWLVKSGAIPNPLKEDGSPVGLDTLAYRGLSGAWLVGEQGLPMYRPDEGSRRAGSHVLLVTGNRVFDRIKKDYLDISRGKKALSTFRSVPIGVAAQSVKVETGGRITLSIFASTKGSARGAGRVVVAPRKLDAGQRAVLGRIVDGTYKHGSAELWWEKRDAQARGKWMLSLSWSGETGSPMARADGPILAGVHLGIANTISIAYVGIEDGVVRSFRDTIQFPQSTVRTWARLRNERKNRSEWNKDVYGARTGRGRQRKHRVVSDLSDKVQRTSDTATKQIAAAVVAAAKRRGAVGIVWEDLADWSVGRMHAEADEMPRSTAAEHRAWYFRWHQGGLRAAIESVSEREGMWYETIDAAFDSRDCSECGTEWRGSGVYRKKGMIRPSPEYGRVRWHEFVCSCKRPDGKQTRMHADRNASRNVAKRALVAWKELHDEAAK